MADRTMLALALGAAVSSQACTLVGFAIGNGVDGRLQKRRAPVPVDAARVARIKIGTPVVIVLESEERIEGELAGWEARPPESLTLAAQAQQRVADGPLPATHIWVGHRQLAVHEVRTVSVRRRGHAGAVAGTILGAVVDAGLVILVNQSLTEGMGIF